MNDAHMLQTATVLLILTALGGAAMAARRLVNKVNPPDWLAMAHGFLAAAAFTLLVYTVVQGDAPGSAVAGTMILAVGALGGVVMNLGHHLRGKLIPQWLLHLHILIGIVGTTLVAWGAWGARPQVQQTTAAAATPSNFG